MIADPLAPLLLAGATGGALPAECRVDASPHVGVVLAASGYPGTVKTGQRIDGLDRLATECPDVHVFHGGVAASGDALVTAGGRVLTVVARGATHAAAIDGAYAAVSRVGFDGMQHRTDIGRKALAQLARLGEAVTARTYAVFTFGCRVNQADSLAIEAELRARGAEPVPADRAGVIVVNTCSVTAAADQGARQTIRRLHRDNPQARIVVTGCFATREPDAVGALPGVAQVIDNDRKASVAAIAVPLVPGMAEGACGRTLAPGLMGRTAWTLRAQTGCEEACSYCIIPTTRGRSRSRSLDDVAGELRGVLDAGYREVNLTGVHLGAWGRDLQPSQGLPDLLLALAGAAGSFRVRVSSLEPMDCTRQVLEVVTTHPERFAPHLHLPLQHAADTVLARMARPYTLAAYSALVDEVRRRLPCAAIGSDVIVGFPGETDAEFETLAEYLERSPITHVHVFPYLGSSRHRGLGAAREGSRCRGQGPRAAPPRHLAAAVDRVPRPPGRHGAPGADARGRARGRDRQLLARAGAARTRSQPVGVGDYSGGAGGRSTVVIASSRCPRNVTELWPSGVSM